MVYKRMSRTLSEYEYKRLITKSKQGWACFYKAETLNHKLQEENYHMWNELKQKTEENKDIIPSFVLEEMNRQGTVIVFPSDTQHRVTPVTKGVRYSLVNWFEGPAFK